MKVTTVIPSRGVASVSRALSIIQILVEHPEHELGVSEIARRIGIGKSTAHQLLSTLVAHGFVEQNENSGLYGLGTRLIEAGAVAASHAGLGPAVTPVLEELVRETGETTSIGIIVQKEIVLVHRVEAQSVLRVDLKVGTRFPLHSSAIGQVILASMPQKACARIFDELALDSKERETAERDVERARVNGYAIVHDTPVAGINAIAVPIRGVEGKAIAGLVIAGPSFRFDPNNVRDTAIKKATLIAQKVGQIHASW